MFQSNLAGDQPGITNAALVGKRSIFPLWVIYSPQHNKSVRFGVGRIGRLEHLSCTYC